MNMSRNYISIESNIGNIKKVILTKRYRKIFKLTAFNIDNRKHYFAISTISISS